MSAPSGSAAKRDALHNAMLHGLWCRAAELQAIGGDRFAARLHELRTLGVVEYESRQVAGADDNVWEYRLRPDLPPPERTSQRRRSASELIKRQAEEIARLRAELDRARAGRAEQGLLFGGSPT